MSILYQALSRAARENARRTTAGTATDATGTAAGPASGAGARLRNFTALSFRPRGRPAAGNRRGLIVLGAVAAVLAGGWLVLSSLSSGDGIPIVSDLAEAVGLTSGAPSFEPFEGGTDDGTAPVLAATDDAALDAAEEAAMLTPPASITDAPAPAGGGIEFEGALAPQSPPAEPAAELAPVAELAPADEGMATKESADAVEEPIAIQPTVAAVAEEAPAALLPESAGATDSLHPTDAPPAQARETLEQTLQRLANERGFTELAPPVEISRDMGVPASAADVGVVEAGTGDADFSITVDDRSQGQQASFEAAYSSLLAGNTEAALNLYLDVLKDDPDNTFALFGLASTLQRIGWLGEARATYEELLAIEPDNRGALANMMTLVSQEAPEQAMANLQRLYEINPGFSPIPAQMAVLFAGQGDYGQAIRFLKLASDLSPENMMYVYNLAIIHDRMGDHDEARTLYEQVLSTAEIRDIGIPLEALRERVSYLKKL